MFFKNTQLAILLCFGAVLSLHAQNKPEKLIQHLRSGTLSGNQLHEEELWTICDYLIEHKNFRGKEDISLIHELGIAYRKTKRAKQEFECHKQRFGSQKASEQTKSLIHRCLKQAGCPFVDVPVFKLKNGVMGAATGLTNAQGIWINEDLIGKDLIELERTCTHEAGHWYYLHGFWPMISDSYTRAQQEFDADEFCFKALSHDTRTSVLARAEQRIKPKNFHHNKTLRDKLKPEIKKIGSEIEYILQVPALEHCHNILAIAQKFEQPKRATILQKNTHRII
jgi:hypothetical protein